MTTSHCAAEEHAFSRRALLHGAAMGSAVFGGFGRLFASDNAARVSSKQKRAILLFMSGGPSQFETWDPKTGQPTGGPHLNIETKLPGIRFDEYMPNLARLADSMAVIRSMTSQLGEHMEGHFLAQTGYKPTNIVAPPPHWLSVCAHEKPSSNPDLPTYVMLGTETGGPLAVPGAGFLGAGYQALYCPGGGKPPQGMPTSAGDELAAYQRRDALRRKLGEKFDRSRNARVIDTHQASFAEAERLLRASDLFDVARERDPARDVERYGQSAFARDCILARRLVEKGVPFVRVQHQTGLAWDKHRRAFDSQRHLTTEFDRVAGCLIEDLIERGLWDDTLLILMGEFGRTPEILGQGPPGRNHWTKSWSLSFGGGGVKGGVVVGETNEKGTDIKDRPVTIPDLFATFYTVLGISPEKELMFEGRPVPLVEDKAGRVIKEVL